MQKVTKNAFGSLIISAVFALVAVFTPLTPGVSAQCGDISQGARGGVDCGNTDNNPNDLFAADGIFTIVVNVLLFIIGAIAVIMLIIGGIRYTISGGDSSAVTSAKNTILYAIVGLIVAFLAYAIVNWVLTAITPA